MEILGLVVEKTFKYLLALPARQIVYLVNFKRNIRILKNQVEKLKMKRDLIQGMVNASIRNLEEPIDEVQGWLASVDDIVKEAMLTIEGEVRENTRCPNFLSQYRLSKKAVKQQILVAELSEKNYDRVAMDRPLPSVELIPTGFIENVESFESAMKQIMDVLKDEEIKRIGIYGMGGVGKTTLMKNLHDRLKETHIMIFKRVIMVTVSTHPDLKKLQGEIAERLGLGLTCSNELTRASKLFQRLQEEERVLIILDDVWERLELSDVGIPHANEHPCCRIIITTRSVEVCEQMESQVKVKVDVLSESDSWNLFTSKVGDVVELPQLKPLAREVAKQCGGLPLAIVTLGWALRGKRNPSVWENALLELKRSCPTSINGMESKVFSLIKLSYDHLGSQEIKMCFLLCCLFPEDYNFHVDVLTRYGVAEGIFKDVSGLKEASNKVQALVETLKASSLLLDHEMGVKMHDVVRDVAISIASKDDPQTFTKAGLGLSEWPEMESGNYKRISLVMNRIERFLPDQPKFPQLLTLLLQHNAPMREIPDKFFEGMKALRVLDLSFTSIAFLPPSLSHLVNLRLLALKRCDKLKDVSQIGGLKSLELLDLRRTKIYELPKEIGELTNLKHLNLTNVEHLAIPPNVISRLTRLEELYMRGSFCKWEVEGGGDGTRATWAEMAFLSRLYSLQVDIENVECLAQDVPLSWRYITEFCIRAGSSFRRGWVNKRAMQIKNVKIMSKWVEILMMQAEFLDLKECSCFKTLDPLDGRGYEILKHLSIMRCDNIEFLLSGDEMGENAFQCLDELHLFELKNLKTLSDRQLPRRSLGNLRVMRVRACERLNNLLSFGLLGGLHHLETLEVSHCNAMENIFGEVVMGENNLVPRLRRLSLSKLPRLSCIWKGMLPLGSFQNLEKLEVKFCSNMRNLFSMVSVSRMGKLKFLTVHGCIEMEEIVSMEGVVSDSTLVLPSLERLRVENLEKLTSIYRGVLAWPSLLEMDIWGCPNFNKLPSGFESATRLRRIKGERLWLEGLKWENQTLTPLLEITFKQTDNLGK